MAVTNVSGNSAPSAKPPPTRKQIEDIFYRRYGRALAAWAAIESILAMWFTWACNANDNSRYYLQEVFFSARSFNGRLEMLKAAFSTPIRDKPLIEFFSEAVKITEGYSSFRNILAHRVTMFHTGRVLLVEGNDVFFQKKNPITDRHLVIATKNFIRLRRVWLMSLPAMVPRPLLTPKEGLERIRALPALAHSNELSRNQRGRLRQRAVQQRSRG